MGGRGAKGGRVVKVVGVTGVMCRTSPKTKTKTVLYRGAGVCWVAVGQLPVD